MAIQTDQIKNIITSYSGKKLLTCLSLIQPLTSNELKIFPNLCFEIFTPNISLKNSKMSFLNNVSNSKKKFNQIFPSIFTNTDLYKRKLKEAIDAGLVISIPETSKKSRYNYYFLNSDINFTINKNGLHIKEDTRVSYEKYKYITSIKKTKLKTHIEYVIDNIALTSQQLISERETSHYTGLNITSIPRLLNLFHLAIKDPSFLEEIQDISYQFINSDYFKKINFHSWNPKTGYKIYSAIKKGLLLENVLDKRSVSVRMQYYGFGNNEYRFARSYNPLKCLSNFDIDEPEMRKKTPIQCLRELTSDNYTIISEQRPFVFTSLIFNIRNIDFNKLNNYLHLTKDKARMFYDIAIIKRNTRFIWDAIYSRYGLFQKMITKKPRMLSDILKLKKYLSEEIVEHCMML